MSALDYYLAAFDDDFTQVLPRRATPIRQQPQQPANPLSALVMSKPRDLPPPPGERKRRGVPQGGTGWNDTSLKGGFSASGVPVEKWTRVDLRRYVQDAYNRRWGGTLPGNPSFLRNYEIISEIEHCLRTQMGIDGNAILKEYFDYFVENLVPSAAAEKGGMSWNKFKYQRYVIAFVKQWKAKAAVLQKVSQPDPEPVAEPPKQPASLSLDAVTDAFRQAPSVLVREFGLIVTINYLMMVRKQPVEKALAYVRTALGKMKSSPDDLRQVFQSTERYNPYPDWLAFADVKELLIDVFAEQTPRFEIGENAAFRFLHC